MLTADLVRPRLRFSTSASQRRTGAGQGQALPLHFPGSRSAAMQGARERELFIDMIDEHDPFWLQTAKELIELLRGQVGRSLEVWDRALETYIGERTDY